jgi:hypothetical protein
LGGLRDLLRRLESGELRMVRGKEDITQSEIALLKREIAYLEKFVVCDVKDGPG